MIDKITADLIARKHYESVYKYCIVMLDHNTHAAQDIAQEVFLLFQLKCDTLTDKNIKGWLLKTAHYKIMEFNRKTGKAEKTTTCLPDEITDNSADICALLEESDSFDINNIEKYRSIILSRLNAKEQQLYHMRYIEGKSNIQIADELDLNPKHVSVMFSRLNKKINTLEVLVLCTAGQLILRLFFH